MAWVTRAVDARGTWAATMRGPCPWRDPDGRRCRRPDGHAHLLDPETLRPTGTTTGAAWRAKGSLIPFP